MRLPLHEATCVMSWTKAKQLIADGWKLISVVKGQTDHEREYYLTREREA